MQFPLLPHSSSLCYIVLHPVWCCYIFIFPKTMENCLQCKTVFRYMNMIYHYENETSKIIYFIVKVTGTIFKKKRDVWKSMFLVLFPLICVHVSVSNWMVHFRYLMACCNVFVSLFVEINVWCSTLYLCGLLNVCILFVYLIVLTWLKHHCCTC